MQYWSRSIEKQVGVRVQRVLRDPYLLKAYQKYGDEVLRRSSVFHGLAEFLTACDVRGETCFEIGTWNGLTAAILSRHFDRVVTVDIEHRPLKRELLEYLGIRNVECIDITDNDHKAAVARDVEFDFAYLDGNHTDDTQIDWDLTKHCGKVLFHEAWPWQEPVFSLLHSLPPDEVRWGEGLALWSKA